MSYSNYQLNQKINNLQQQINNIPPPAGEQDLNSVLIVGNSAGTNDINMNNNDILAVDNINLTTINNSVYPPIIPTDTLSSVLAAGNSAGTNDINMNNNDILAVDNINLTTINNSVYPPIIPTDNLQNVLIAGNTASGTSALITLTNLPKQNFITPTSVFLNDTTIVQQATLNTEKLRLLTSGLTNDITSSKMSIVKPATSSISEYGTDGVSLTGLLGAENRSASFNLNTGFTTTNNTSKASGTLNESFLSLDSNSSSSALGNKTTLNATSLICVNKVTPSTTSSLSSTALNVGISGSTVTVNSSGVSSTNILNLNSSSQIDVNCPIRILANPPSSGSRTTISNAQVVVQNVVSTLQNTVSSTSSAITNGTKTISMTVDGISSTGPMSLGTATVNLTTTSTGITQSPLNNSTKIATTSYVDTAISAIPTPAAPTLQSVINTGNTITNGTKTLTLNVDGINSTGEIVIGNVSSTTQLNGTTTAIKIKSTDYDTTDAATLVKLGDSLTTGSLDLGKNITTGIINLGTQMTTGNLNIMSNAQTTGSITMLKNTGTGKLFVLGGGIDTNLITTGEVKATNINPYTTTQDLKIGGGITNREIIIGENMVTNGAIYIGSSASTINLVSDDCNAITQTTGDNTTRVATTAFVNSSIAAAPVPTLQAVITKNDDLQGITPALNQIIKYNGSNVVWSDLPASVTPSLQAVINVNDDLQGITPTTNQIIKYNGSSVVWSDLPTPPATPALSAVLVAGNSAGTNNLNMNNQNITNVNNISVSTINSAPYPPIASVSTLQQVLDAGNSANKTIVLTDGSYLNDITPSQINITNDAGTEQLIFSNQSLTYTTPTNLSILNNASLGFQNTDNSINSNLTKNGLTFITAETNNSFSNNGAVLSGFIGEQLKNCSMTLDNGFFNRNEATFKESTFKDDVLYLLDETNKINRSLTLTNGLLQEINTDNIALGTKSLLSDSTLTLINKETSEITTIIPSSSTITDGVNTSVINNSGLGIVEPFTNKSTYYNLNDFLISKTVGNVSSSVGSSSEILSLGTSDSVLLTSSNNQLTSNNIIISNATNSITFNPLSFIYNTITTNWADIATNAALALYARLAGTNLFTGPSNTFQNSVIVKTSPIATIVNTISNIGMSLIDTGKSTFYNLDGLNIQKIVGPINYIFGAQPDVINISSTDSSLLTSNNIQIASDYIYLTDETTFTNSITSDDIQISNGTLKTIYNSNSIISTDNLTINSAPTKILKIGSGSATENVEIATQAARSVVLHLGDGINNIAGSGVHINNGTNSVGNTQINNGSGQTGQINIGNATSGTTTTNINGITNINTSGTTTTTIGVQSSTINMRGGVNINTSGTGGFSNTTIGIAGSVTSIRGTTEINTSGGGTTTIGTSGSGTSAIRGATVNIDGVVNINSSTNTGLITIGNTSVGAITNILGTQVNLTNPRINQPITPLYSSILPAVGLAGLNQIGGKEVYTNTGNGNGFFTTTGTTKQVYAFINNIPTGRYIVLGLLSLNNNIASTTVDMRTVYNNNTVPSFPQPLTLNQTLTLTDYPFGNNFEASTFRPNNTTRNTLQETVVIDITASTGNQIGLTIVFGTATIGGLNQFSLYLTLSITRIS
jgi:hypothetical protein